MSDHVTTIGLGVIGENKAYSCCIGLRRTVKLGHSVDVPLTYHTDEQVDVYMYSSTYDGYGYKTFPAAYCIDRSNVLLIRHPIC
jgi:hypothetical protein